MRAYIMLMPFDIRWTTHDDLDQHYLRHLDQLNALNLELIQCPSQFCVRQGLMPFDTLHALGTHLVNMHKIGLGGRDHHGSQGCLVWDGTLSKLRKQKRDAAAGP